MEVVALSQVNFSTRWHSGVITQIYDYQLDDGRVEKRVAGHHERPEKESYRFKGKPALIQFRVLSTWPHLATDTFLRFLTSLLVFVRADV